MSLVKHKKPILYNEAVELIGHENGSTVLCSRFSPSGELIASAGTDRSIILWDLPTHQRDEFHILKGHSSAITSLRWASEDTIATSSADTSIGLWDVELGKRTRKMMAHELCVNEIAVSTTEQILSVSDDGWACVWDQRDKFPVLEIETENPLLSGVFDGNFIYIGGIEGRIKAFDLRKPSRVFWECESPAGEAITSIVLGEQLIAVRGMEGTIGTYSTREFVPENVSRKSPYAYVGAPSGQESQAIKANFSNDKQRILSGSEDKSVTIWDVGTKKVCKKLTGHRATTIDVDFHPNDQVMVSSSIDGSIIVWEI